MDKYHLYTNPIEDSFDYFYETHADALEDDFNGELYYDNEKNVTILNGVEYPPEMIDNPEYYIEGKRLGAFLFEIKQTVGGTI